MPEQTLGLPLSGAEIKDELTAKFREFLDRDCLLNNTSSYRSRRGTLSIEIHLVLSDTDELSLDREVTIETGEGEEPEGGTVTDKRVDYTFVEQAPDLVRTDNDLPVPTIDKSSGKPEVKGVRYKGNPKSGATKKTVTKIEK